MSDSAPQPGSLVPASWSRRLVVAAACLALLHFPPRAQLLGFVNRSTLTRPIRNVPKLLISGTYDVAWVAGLCALFLLLLVPLQRRRPRAAGAVYVLFLFAGALSLIAAMANTQVVPMLGRTFNYRWLYYSDFLQSVDARQAILAGLSWKVMAAMACLCAAFVALSVAMGRWVDRRVARMTPTRRRVMLAALVGVLAVYLIAGRWYLVWREWPHEKLVNPVYAFARSAVEASRAPALFTMHTDIGDEDFSPPPARPPATTRPVLKDVIVFVLESTPAEYLGAYGCKYPGVTPNLDRWAARAAVFDNIYAHAPATNKSLCSILCSLYPWISYKTVSQEKPDIAAASIVTQLEPHGYASGFFFSGDLSYQGSGDFVRARGFDLVQDYRQRKRTRTIFTHDKWPFLNGSDDLSTAESLLGWLDQQRAAGKPAFAMLWTMMTHYPYFVGGEIADFGPKENLFNHYLNALHAGDAAFGAVMDHLEKENRLDQTLVIVVGDHGEAFGRHDQLSHGNKIYDENCHVPLLLINPILFKGERRKTVAGLVDIAPTITDLLGLAPAPTWQGRSLFDPSHPDRTYFFTPWSDYLFGYREGNTKFIYNASTDRYELYDLARDPTEQTNLIASHAAQVNPRVKRLAAWVQYQNRMFDRLMKR